MLAVAPVLASIAIAVADTTGSHADSLRAAAVAAARELYWHRYSVEWRDFYLLSGTAAVTLAGLLFVAVSLHIETLIHDSRRHLLALARAILFSFVIVLTLSLIMLVPDTSLRVTGVMMAMVGGAGLALSLRAIRSRAGSDHSGYSRGASLRRALIPLLGYLWIGATGVFVVRTRNPEVINLAIGGICMLLGNSVGASWELLVETAKIKRHAENKADVG